jgi:hypothetical protein
VDSHHLSIGAGEGEESEFSAQAVRRFGASTARFSSRLFREGCQDIGHSRCVPVCKYSVYTVHIGIVAALPSSPIES